MPCYGRVVAEASDMDFVQGALRLQFKELMEIIDNGGVIRAHLVGNRRQQDAVLGVKVGNLFRITGLERSIPLCKKADNLVFVGALGRQTRPENAAKPTETAQDNLIKLKGLPSGALLRHFLVGRQNCWSSAAAQENLLK